MTAYSIAVFEFLCFNDKHLSVHCFLKDKYPKVLSNIFLWICMLHANTQ